MKKILSIIAISLVALIAGAVIAFAFIPKQFNVNLTDPSYIRVFASDGQIETALKGSAKYDYIMEKYEQSFDSTLLSSLFQGRAFASPSIADKYHTLNVASLVDENEYYLEFCYDAPQTVTFNGEEYQDDDDNKYLTIMIQVKDSSVLSEIKLYARYGAAGTVDYSYYNYTTYAAQSELFAYLQTLAD